MKTFNQFVTEVQKPLSQGEKNFFNAHNPINHKDLVPGVTDQEHVFNGSPQRKDPKTASYEGDESSKVYDKGLKNKEVSIEEKTLTPNEVKKREEIVKSLKSKGMDPGKAYPIATATAKRVTEEDDGWYTHKEMHGKNAVSKEDWKKGVRLNSKGKRVQMKSEEVEQIDELGRSTLMSYGSKSMDAARDARKKGDKATANKRSAGVERASSKLFPAMYKNTDKKSWVHASEEVEALDERNKENKFKKDLHVASLGKSSIDKFDVDHDKMAKDFGHSRDRIRDTMKSRLKTFKRVGRQMTKEESEQIDEISKEKALNYVGAASFDKSSHASDIGAINQIARTTGTNDAQRKEREALSKKHGNRSLGIQRAAAKLAGKGVKVPATEEVENVNELDHHGILSRYIRRTDPERNSPKENEKRKAGRALALSKKWADHTHGDIEPKIKARVREESEIVEGMPSSIVKSKQRYSEMSASDFAKAHGGKSEAELKSMAWRHGYGKDSSHYVDKVKKGMSSEELELDEAKRGRPSKNPEKKAEVASDADQNIHTQLHKSLSIGKHVAFKNGDVKQVPAAHANKALHMLRSAKPSEREQLQTSMSHSHDRFTKTVTHGRAVIDHPGVKKVSVAKSVKEEADPTSRASDKGAMTAAVRQNADGRMVVMKRTPARSEIKIGEALDPVGKEDSDIDNDGKHHTKTDKYLHNRRKSIKAAIRGAVKEAQELTAASVAAAGQFQYGRGQSGSENMQQDSVNKLKTDPLASKEAVSLPPTQGNKAIGGESNPSRVGGKYSMEEEILLNNLYSVLSEENQAMFEELLETEEGIEQLLSFAQEQGLE